MKKILSLALVVVLILSALHGISLAVDISDNSEGIEIYGSITDSFEDFEIDPFFVDEFYA